MRIIRNFLTILGGVLLFSSCLTTQSVPIDQLEPGKVAIPSAIRKVAIIARNFKFSVDTLGGYSNIDFRLRKGSKVENQLIDSISVTESLDHLRKALLESGRFDEVFVYPFNAITPYKAAKELPLTPSFIQSLCKESETDAVVSLEMLSFFYSRHKGSSGKNIEAGANVKVTAIWAVYTPGRDGSIDRYTHSEVIKWKEGVSQKDGKSYQLPDRKEAIAIACGEAAKNYSKRIVPSWEESSRMIMALNGYDWEQALNYADKNKWESAAAIWQKYTQSSQTKVAGVAALNFAVAQEMLGNFDQAALWSDKAVKMLKTGEAGQVARDYAAILYERKLKAERLNQLLKVDRP